MKIIAQVPVISGTKSIIKANSILMTLHLEDDGLYLKGDPKMNGMMPKGVTTSCKKKIAQNITNLSGFKVESNDFETVVQSVLKDNGLVRSNKPVKFL